MIWATAKSTEVSRRHSPRPARARMFGPADRVEAAETAVGVAMSDPQTAAAPRPCGRSGSVGTRGSVSLTGRMLHRTPPARPGEARRQRGPRRADGQLARPSGMAIPVTRSLPARFEAYIAPSALIISSSTVRPSPG